MRLSERRTTAANFEVRSIGGKTVIEGHAAVFNSTSQNLGGFVERVAPSAFTKTIGEADIRALFNHDPSMILGRNISGTLDLSTDSTGLLYRIQPGSRSYEADLMESMDRGDVTQSSFTFEPIVDEWGYNAQDFPMRTLNEVRLFDVSPVTFPAYLDADSGLAKRAFKNLAESRGLDPSKAYDLRALIEGRADVPVTGDDAADTDPGVMAQAVDACIDAAASALAAGDLETVKALLDAADTSLDELLALLGVDDPDEGSRSLAVANALSRGGPPSSTRSAGSTTALYAALEAQRF